MRKSKYIYISLCKSFLTRVSGRDFRHYGCFTPTHMMFMQNAASLARKELSGAFSRPLVLLKLEENQLEFHLGFSFFIDRSFIRFSLLRSFSCFIDKREEGTSICDAKSRNRISRISSDVRTITE